MEPPLTLKEARALLGVGAEADARTLRRAWARALQAARPDLSGGGDARYRRVIAAHRLLSAVVGRDDFVLPLATRPPPRRDRRCEMVVSAAMAGVGGWRRLRIAGTEYRVRVPAGVRDGAVLRLRGRSPDGGDVLIALTVPAVRSAAADSLRRRFSEAWAA